MPYVRTVKTKSGATAVRIVYSWRRGSRDIEHIGSAHDDAELEALKAVARQVLRHRSARSTAIYAKVDEVALRPLARPWPGTWCRRL